MHAVRFTAEHNYNKDSREAMYAWMARWLQHAPPTSNSGRRRSFSPDPLADLLVFHHRALPAESAVTRGAVDRTMDRAAKAQLATTPIAVRAAALRHALVAGDRAPPRRMAPQPADAPDGAARRRTRRGGSLCARPGSTSRPVAFTPFDADAAAGVRHFETYNRTPASQRVADIVAAARADPGATLVAGGERGAGRRAGGGDRAVRLVDPRRRRFDTTSDGDFLDRVYIPGIRRAGDFQTAMDAAPAGVVIHNAERSIHGDRRSGDSNETDARRDRRLVKSPARR